MAGLSRASRKSRRLLSLCWLGIVVAVVAAWVNSLETPFVLDDHESIVANPSLRGGVSDWVAAEAERGGTVSGRPVLNVSFALNFLARELDVRGYHWVNIVLHGVAALLLFGVLRRTPWVPGRHKEAAAMGPWGQPTPWLAMAITLVWALHPLQTAAVTYISQRAEVLAGVFYLLTLYAFIRSVQTDADQSIGRRGWVAVAVGACWLGVASKETLVTAPLMVMLYDRMFIAGSFRAAWRARRGLYIGLLSSWLPLALLVATNAGRGGTAGVATAMGTWNYLLTQCDAIVTYLRLAVWPAGQVYDYGTPLIASVSAVWWQAGVLIALLGATILALWKKWAAGFWGAWFFVLLAPTSSVVVVATQTMAEHRMYLPLLGVVMIISLAIARGLNRLPQSIAGGVFFGIAIALGAATIARNSDYRSTLSLWQDTVEKRPDNPRAHHNLGVALAQAGRTDEARDAYRRAISLQPNHAFAHFNLGALLAQDGNFAEALEHFRACVLAAPDYADARLALAETLRRSGRQDEAQAQLQAVAALAPDSPQVGVAVAASLVEQGRVSEGIARLREVLRREPAFWDAHYQLGLALEKDGRRREADAAFREALISSDDPGRVHLAMGNNLRAAGDMRAAENAYRDAVRLAPRMAEAHYALGNLLARKSAFAEAIQALREAIALDPAHIEARNNLGNCLLMTGNISEAIVCYDEVLKRRPDDAMALQNREIARQALREGMGR